MGIAALIIPGPLLASDRGLSADLGPSAARGKALSSLTRPRPAEVPERASPGGVRRPALLVP